MQAICRQCCKHHGSVFRTDRTSSPTLTGPFFRLVWAAIIHYVGDFWRDEPFLSVNQVLALMLVSHLPMIAFLNNL